MNDKASKIRSKAWELLVFLLALLLGSLCILNSEFNRMTDDERQCLIKGLPLIFIPLILLSLLTIAPLRPHVRKFAEDKLEKFEEKFKRQFLKHPYLSALPVIILPIGLGFALSHALGLRPREVHPWTIADYVAVFLMMATLLGGINACRNQMLKIPEEIKSGHRRRQTPFMDFFRQLIGFFYSLALRVRMTTGNQRFLASLIAQMEKELNDLNNQELMSHEQHLMDVTIASFPSSLFAKDVLGEAVFLKTADGDTLKIFDEDFPIPAKKTMQFSMLKDQKEGYLQLSLSENGSRISTDYVISNVPNSPAEHQIVAVTFVINLKREVALHVKKPLIIKGRSVCLSDEAR